MSKVILGTSTPIKNLLNMISRVAATKTNILVIGESGTGKELVARMIHDSGILKGKPFIPVNCGAIPENLIESEMFGHKKGSFTGAIADRQGLFQAADGGTLFLDEVGELPLNMQVKLLRAIQERVFQRVGGTEDIRVDVRIIAATNRDLEAGVAKGTFREDLYYRLNVIQIRTPPLRERRSDIMLLAEAFLKRIATKYSKDLEGFDDETRAVLEAHAWPGNVRELENVVERAVTLENAKKVSLHSLPPSVSRSISDPNIGGQIKNSLVGLTSGSATEEIRLPAPNFSKGPLDLDKILGEVERTYLMAALDHASGVKKKAADHLGITFRSIRYRLKKLGVELGSDDVADAGDEGEE